MKKLAYIFAMTISAVSLIGCAVTSLQPGADKILVTTNKVPDSCHYIGQVTARDVNGSTQMYSSHEHLQADQINRLKNQAVKLGANVVVVNTHKTTYIKTRAGELLDTHSMSGMAYQCPDNILNKGSPQKRYRHKKK